MESVPVFGKEEADWKCGKLVDVLGVKIPSYFTSDPSLLQDYISNFQTRPDDVFVVSYPKSGTTWVLEIVWQIYNEGKKNSKRIEDRCPFLEEATNLKSSQPDIDTLPSPRLIKTHLPYHVVPKAQDENADCKYVYIARNPKDTAVSFFEFMVSLGTDFEYQGPWDFFAKLFLDGNLQSNLWSDHVLGWWQHRNDPNVLYLKYEDLQKDLLSNVRLIATFLNKSLSEDVINLITEQCTFTGMMRNAPSYWLRGREDGPKLLRKGVVGDWKNYFTPEQNERFENELLAKLQGSGLEFDFSG